MNFRQAIAACISKYIVFEGRACRSEYWYFYLFFSIVGLFVIILDQVFFSDYETSPFRPPPFYTLFALTVILPWLAVAVRRLHDINKSGWWLLLYFVPIVGAFIVFFWSIKAGDRASNRFGADPLAAAATQPV
jgi:uncharacterized membrane protein YhaH (DUF805 family)